MVRSLKQDCRPPSPPVQAITNDWKCAALSLAMVFSLAAVAEAETQDNPAPVSGGAAASGAQASEPANSGAGKAEEAKKPAKPAKPPEPVQVVVAPAFGALHLSGSRADYYHYNTPPSHLYLDLLQALRLDPEGYPQQEFWWRNLGATDESGYMDAHLGYPTFIRFWRNTSQFYGDPQLPCGRYSDREDTRAQIRLASRLPGPVVDFSFWNQQLSVPAIRRLQPFPGIDYSTNVLALKATVPIGSGVLEFEPRHLSFDNNLNRFPGGDTTWLRSEFSHPVGSAGDLSAGFDRITTHVSGQDLAVWNVFRFQGDLKAAEGVFVDAYFRQQGVDLPFTQTNYLNRSSLAAVDLNAYPMRHASVRGGVFREEIRRQEAGSTGEEYAAWTGSWARLQASRPGVWAANLRFREKDLSNAPDAEIPRLPSSDTLYYEHDRQLDARFDLFPSRRSNAYFIYGWRQRNNGQRDTELTLNSFTGGATASMSRRLNVSAEVTQQFWDGNTGPLRAASGPPPGGLPPRLFFSDARIFTAGASYDLDRRSSLDLSLNVSNSTGGQSARDYLATLEYRRSVSREFFYSAGIQFESFTDSHLDRGYTAFPLVFQAGYRKEFR